MAKTKFFGMGGFKEIGKSTLLIEHEQDIILIDSGIKFADSSTTGLNGMIPNFSYLEKNNKKLKALFITHGHEDHIGGVVYLLKQVKVPKIYAPRIAIEYLRLKFKEHPLNEMNKNLEFVEIKAKDSYKIGKHFKVDFWTAQHSIPDAFGIRVRTVNGSLLMTGDYRFDYTPITNFTDFSKLKQIGDEGLTVLFSDSTNAMRPGHSPSEKDTLHDIEQIIIESKQKVIVTGFASNLSRMKEILLLGVKHGRKIAIFGRSMVSGIDAGRKLGYLKVSDNVFVDKRDIHKYDDSEIMILTTGSQGEELAALSRMSYGKHPQVKIKNDDTIIFSSSPIPGNRMKIELLINRLFKLGADIKENGIDGYLHTSGHAYVHEHEKTFQLTRPKYFVPYHGDYRMEVAHGMTAIEQGVKPDNIIYPNIGQIVYMENEELTLSDEIIDVSPIYIDGGTVLEDTNKVVSERYVLGESGFVNAIIVIDKEKNTIVGRPRIISKGSLFIRNSKNFLEQTNKLVHSSILYYIKNNKKWKVEDLEKLIIDRLSIFFFKEKRRKPIVIPTIILTGEPLDQAIVDFKQESKSSSEDGDKKSSKTSKSSRTSKPKKRPSSKKTANKKEEETNNMSSTEKLLNKLKKIYIDEDEDSFDDDDDYHVGYDDDDDDEE